MYSSEIILLSGLESNWYANQPNEAIIICVYVLKTIGPVFIKDINKIFFLGFLEKAVRLVSVFLVIQRKDQVK